MTLPPSRTMTVGADLSSQGTTSQAAPRLTTRKRWIALRRDGRLRWAADFCSDRVAACEVWWSVWWSKRFCASAASLAGGGHKPLTRDFAAEEVGFEPTDPCRSHDFQSCRFGRSRTPPKDCSTLSLHLLALSRAVAGFCATGDREPSQGRKAAALSGFVCVPQGTWLLRTTAREP